jgi:Asp-tRNA(Asn)/Glu-tRNA(Gln) amidotransferase B subunit
MSFLRHVGKIGDRKVAIVFREVPNESHMALVVYTESLNRHIHDPLMKCIESDIGQNSENLADALNRTHTNDGKIILQVMHKEGLLKKVQTNQVVMTPSPSTQIKLDELNKILDEMQQGEEAVKRLTEMDESLGMQSAKQVAQRMRNKEAAKSTPPVGVPDVPGVLGDTALANNLKQQAARMEAEAKGLLAESARLNQEANEMLGVSSTSTTSAPTAKKRGRPAKATATA